MSFSYVCYSIVFLLNFLADIEQGHPAFFLMLLTFPSYSCLTRSRGSCSVFSRCQSSIMYALSWHHASLSAAHICANMFNRWCMSDVDWVVTVCLLLPDSDPVSAYSISSKSHGVEKGSFLWTTLLGLFAIVILETLHWWFILVNSFFLVAYLH